jgi:hypothetical protein
LRVDRALEALAPVDERKCRVTEMRFFGGLTVEETAEALHVSGERASAGTRSSDAAALRRHEPMARAAPDYRAALHASKP